MDSTSDQQDAESKVKYQEWNGEAEWSAFSKHYLREVEENGEE